MNLQKARLKKLNTFYNSDPNVARPKFETCDNNVVLFFPLNYFHGNFEEDAVGKIEFKNCLMFRIGDPNDEGFLDPTTKRNKSQWNKLNYPDMELDSFYQIEGLNWVEGLGPHTFMDMGKDLTDEKQIESMKHFLFLMKDGSFECVASDFREIIPMIKK